MAITSAYCTSAKAEHFWSAHCFAGQVTPTGTTSSGGFQITSLSSAVGIVVGMAISGSGIPSGAVVASVDSATAITISKAATASASGVTLTLVGDVFRLALFKAGVSGSYGAATVNYTDMGADETSGTGYTATGVALTNVSPTTSGTTAFVNFSPNPAWTSATFSTDGGLVYNSNARLGGTSGSNTQGAGRAVGVFSWGGTQTVSSGVLTILMPAATSSTAIFRIG